MLAGCCWKGTVAFKFCAKPLGDERRPARASTRHTKKEQRLMPAGDLKQSPPYEVALRLIYLVLNICWRSFNASQ